MDTPRLLAPLSTATVTSQTPTLHWQLAPGTTGVHVEVCVDRACAHVAQGFDAVGSAAAMPSALAPGVHFWHARGIDGNTYGPTWEFWVGHRNAPTDTSWGSTLDVNGDGYADVAVGADGTETEYVWLGGSTGLATMPATTLTGPPGSRFYRYEVASAGDINGDGYADLLVEDYALGAVYVYPGGATGIGSVSAILRAPSDAPVFGDAIAGVGDVNGDGYADVVVGGDENAFLYLGSGAGLNLTPITLRDPDQPGADFGHSLSSAGDLNGDGYGDLAVGAVNANSVRVYTAEGCCVLGISEASAGDVNGDGYADLLLGTDNASATYLYYGSASGLAATPIILSGTANPNPASITGAGDVNGDGYADFVVSNGDVCLGSATGPGALWPGTMNNDPLSGAISGAGDTNGDGFDDLIEGNGGDTVFLGNAEGQALPVIDLDVPGLGSDFGGYCGGCVASAQGSAASTTARVHLGQQQSRERT